MEKRVVDFYKRLGQAIQPSIEWTAQDSAMLWRLPFSELRDYLALKSLKKKVSLFKSPKNPTIEELKPFVGYYIKAVNKGHKHCVDYLFTVGDIVLSEMVQMHFEDKFGKDSPRIDKFIKNFDKVWNKVIDMRQSRRRAFLEKEIDTLFNCKGNYRNYNSFQLQNFLDNYMKKEDKIDCAIKRAEEFKRDASEKKHIKEAPNSKTSQINVADFRESLGR